ncbi:JmjC domain protein [Venturia nashicola]|uniref:JmjC domain protein n=1 Tax=Venturia nashicola TaxID=86259 RepID=A0A4Z1P3Z9_9PEZI|nr:JmjC domain protein [Venturia nashicola]
MPLPRPLPFTLRFTALPGTKVSAVRQPDHFKWKFVKNERPVFFERGQFKDEIGAVGRWFGCVKKDEGASESREEVVRREEARDGTKKAREMAALSEEAWMKVVEESVSYQRERGVVTVGKGGKVKMGIKKKDLMKDALIRKATKIREENQIRKGMAELEGDVPELIEKKAGEIQMPVVKKEVEKEVEKEEDDYDHAKYKKEKPVSRLLQKKSRGMVLSLKTEWLKKAKEVDEAYWEPFGGQTVPLEKVTRIPNGEGEGKDTVKFERFEAPLFVFLAWNKRKLQEPETYQPNIDLYLAQYSLSNLPKELRADLPTPYLLAEGGLGLTSSSLWMGVPPTDTPLHKDPNANFFVQLAGRKKIRMIRPEDGDLVYSTIRNIVADETGRAPFAGDFQNGKFGGLGAKMRGDEMMSGLEKKLMDSLIWGDDHGVWSGQNKKVAKWYKTGRGRFEYIPEEQIISETSAEADRDEEASTTGQSSASEVAHSNEETSTIEGKKIMPSKRGHFVPPNDKGLPLFKGFEAELGPGDGCHIPMGWWHSLRGIPETPLGINASANWWFRAGKVKKSIRDRRERENQDHTESNAEESERIIQRTFGDAWEEGKARVDSVERARRKKEEKKPSWDGSGRGSSVRGDALWRPKFLGQQSQGEREEMQPEPKRLIRKYESEAPIVLGRKELSFPDLTMDGGTKTYWHDVVEGGEEQGPPIRKYGIQRNDDRYHRFGVGTYREGEGVIPIRKSIAKDGKVRMVKGDRD